MYTILQFGCKGTKKNPYAQQILEKFVKKSRALVYVKNYLYLCAQIVYYTGIGREANLRNHRDHLAVLAADGGGA